MKQTKFNTAFFIATMLLISMAISALTVCVQWKIGGYVPLTISLCTIGIMLLMGYSVRVEREQHVNVPYSSYDKSEYEQELYSPKDSNKIVIGFCEYTPTEEEIREYIKEYQLSEYD